MTSEQGCVNSSWRSAYKFISLCLSLIFGVVGLLLLFLPEGVLILFNTISSFVGFQKSAVYGVSLYLILSVGYMYLVTLFAFLMYRQPDNKVFPMLLVNGKSASSILSFLFFLVYRPYLIFLTNGVIDGLIAVGVFVLNRKARGALK